MEVKEIKESEFKDVIKEKGKVLIDCYATWCGPCQLLSPIVDEVAKENKTCKFYKLDIDEAYDVSSEYGIMSIPTLLLFEDGKIKNTSLGLITKEELEDFIQ